MLKASDVSVGDGVLLMTSCPRHCCCSCGIAVAM